MTNPAPIYDQVAASLTVTDLRTSNHVIQILKAGKAADLYSPSAPVSQVFEHALTQVFNQQGMSTNGGAINIEVLIDKAIVSVQQQTLKYQANSDIQLRVVVSNGEQTLTNTVKSKGNSNGPLSADIAVLERDLNQQLAKVVNDITQNPKMIALINGN